MLIKGNIHTDERGVIRFFNDFSFDGVQRFYVITHSDTNVIRAWQGHKTETKFFIVAKGAFVVNWIKIKNWKDPSEDLEINSKILTDRRSEILIIPPGHVNGFKAVESESTIIVYSDKTLQESQEDDFRYPLEYWKFQR